uniref:CCHC-type domain-containing protein n=1 Tax=Anopheles atroparvus TaxID=41427 RepID=A0AAG5DR78_ANOAO
MKKALRKALLAEFGKKARPSDVHRQLATRRRAKNEKALDFVYSMQRIGKQIDLDEESICEYIIDGITEDETQRATLYEARTISALKEKIERRERAKEKDEVRKKSNASQGDDKKQSMGKQNSKVRCYNCGEIGHRSSVCTHKN